MRELDEEVLRTVRQQTSAGSSARKDLENAKASVAELFLKVRDIGCNAGHPNPNPDPDPDRDPAP